MIIYQEYQMNRCALFLLAISLSGCFGCKSPKTPDRVDEANKANARKTYENSVREHVSEFLVKIADARMMDMREGELAIKRGTTSLVREYGALMVKDQTALMVKIKKLADERGLTLPADISNSKKDGLNDLLAKEGKDFNEKFIRMMILDHERDVEDFKDAINLKDKEISKFASSNLPIIESHLMKAKTIKEGQ